MALAAELPVKLPGLGGEMLLPSGWSTRRLAGLQSTLKLALSVAVEVLLWGKLCGSPAAPS
jgi:hypothetical protein